MTAASHLTALDAEFDALAGTVSVWCGPIGALEPRYARLPDVTHYAASTMKTAVLAALYRRYAAGTLDIDAAVPVVNDFASTAPGASRFAVDRDGDSDAETWALIGQSGSLRWLARRMIVRSGNLATNLVLARVGIAEVNDVFRLTGATVSRVGRGIHDAAARDAGIDNLVTARDLALLHGAIAAGAGSEASAGLADMAGRRLLAPPDACAAMLDVLLAQEHREDLAVGLPAGVRLAHKSGWVSGVRHAAGVVFPHDAEPYAIAVCTTGLDGDPRALIARVAAASWADRRAIGAPATRTR